MPSVPLQSARIVAGSLALLAREIKEVGPPVDLWCPPISPSFISGIASQVGQGKAIPIWVEEHYPARGLAIYTHSEWESNFFGFNTVRLIGPFMVVEDQSDREQRAHKLAHSAIIKARHESTGLICVKTIHDPAILRGFLSSGFVLAEICSGFQANIEEKSKQPVTLPSGFKFLDADGLKNNEMLDLVISEMGDFFYDGHYRHDPHPGPDFARRMWSLTAKDDLSGMASPALVIWDRIKKTPAAIGSVRSHEDEAFLSILAVAARYRGKGLGGAILQELLNRLPHQTKNMNIETASYNLPALNLYQSLGFKHTAPLVALHYHNLSAQTNIKQQ